MSLMHGADRWLSRLTGLFTLIGGLMVVALVGVTIVAVVWRYALGQPIYGIEDVTKMALLLTVAGAIVYGARHESHVYVDIISSVVSGPVQRVLDVVARLIGIGIVALTAYALLEKGSCGFACGYFTQNLAIPHKPFYFALSASMAIYSIGLILELVSVVTGRSYQHRSVEGR